MAGLMVLSADAGQSGRRVGIEDKVTVLHLENAKHMLKCIEICVFS
jgi:hypothetical protein